MKKRILKVCAIGVLLFNSATAATAPVFAQESSDVSSQQTKLPVTLSLVGDTPLYKAGESGVVTVQVTNTSQEPLTAIQVTPIISASTAEWPFEIQNVNLTQTIERLEGGQSTSLQYEVSTRTDVASQYYPLTFTIQQNNQSLQQTVYVKTEGTQSTPPQQEEPSSPPAVSHQEDDAVHSGSTAQQVGGGITNSDPVPTSGSAQTNGSVPRIIVTGFTTAPSEVKAGETVKLTVKLKNTSTATAIKNMLINFSATAQGQESDGGIAAFLPASGASAIYVDAIPANSEKEVTIELIANKEAAQKAHALQLAMNYENDSQTQFEATATISLFVKQEARVELSKLEANAQELTVGDDMNITTNLYNLGRVKLYNAKVTVHGETISSNEVFLGTVEVGATSPIDVIVNAEKVTGAEGKPITVTVTFEDNVGNVQTVEKQVTVVINAEKEAPAINEPQEAQSSSFGWELPVGIGGVLCGLVWWLRKKKKEGTHFDEMD